MIRIETFRVGLRELSGNKLRTALTTLGIVFGVAAVIAMVSIAEGARHETLAEVQALGTNSIRIRAVTLQGQDLAHARQIGESGVSRDDIEALGSLPLVAAVVPLVVVNVPVRRGERTADARIVGTSARYPEVVSYPVAQGRFLLPGDEVQRASVAVVGAKAAQQLLPFRPALGEQITLGNQTFKIVGVMQDRREASARASALNLGDLGRDIYIPAATAIARFQRDPAVAEVSEVAVRVVEGGDVRMAASLARDMLARRHQGVVDFEVVVPEELLRQSQKSQRVFNIVMGAIASISLLVGGIGIMNVMLVTVIQRTREIGIRRAVGATRKDIRDQFLVEALTIAVLGGLAGGIVGSVLASVISIYAGWVTIVSLKAILVAFFVAGATGVVFGLIPAVKASAVDPIECLRHE